MDHSTEAALEKQVYAQAVAQQGRLGRGEIPSPDDYMLRNHFDILCRAAAIRKDEEIMKQLRAWVKTERDKLMQALDDINL